MRDKRRIERILGLIEKYWKSDPDQRFGQLLINIGILPDFPKIWNLEDETIEIWLKEKIEYLLWKTKGQVSSEKENR